MIDDLAIKRDYCRQFLSENLFEVGRIRIKKTERPKVWRGSNLVIYRVRFEKRRRSGIQYRLNRSPNIQKKSAFSWAIILGVKL